MKQPIDVDTSKNAQLNKGVPIVDESKVKVNVPISILRWLFYSICFANLLIPFFYSYPWKVGCGGLILGWFASQLNALIHKK